MLARVWFSARVAPYVKERQWASKQSIDEQTDGTVILSLETSGFDDLKRWVLSFGGEARVLAPTELAQAVQEDARETIRAYESPAQ